MWQTKLECSYSTMLPHVHHSQFWGSAAQPRLPGWIQNWWKRRRLYWGSWMLSSCWSLSLRDDCNLCSTGSSLCTRVLEGGWHSALCYYRWEQHRTRRGTAELSLCHLCSMVSIHSHSYSKGFRKELIGSLKLGCMTEQHQNNRSQNLELLSGSSQSALTVWAKITASDPFCGQWDLPPPPALSCSAAALPAATTLRGAACLVWCATSEKGEGHAVGASTETLHCANSCLPALGSRAGLEAFWSLMGVEELLLAWSGCLHHLTDVCWPRQRCCVLLHAPHGQGSSQPEHWKWTPVPCQLIVL